MKIKNKKPKFEIIYHYPKDDKNCSTDYSDVEIKFNGIKVQEYGDYYHDKGHDKTLGFIDGYKFAASLSEHELEVIRIDISDR